MVHGEHYQLRHSSEAAIPARPLLHRSTAPHDRTVAPNIETLVKPRRRAYRLAVEQHRSPERAQSYSHPVMPDRMHELFQVF